MKPLRLILLLTGSFLTAGPGSGSSSAEPARSTVITSERLEMEGSGDRNFFYFEGDVKALGTNLRLLCDQLTVISARAGSAPNEEAIGEIGAIEEIIASGNVEIHQAGRSAFAGKAVVDPRDGTVTLSDDPRVTDGEVEITGYQFVLHRGEKRFESIPDPNAPMDQPSRSVVRLGALPDLGFDKAEDEVQLDDRIDESPDETDSPNPSFQAAPGGDSEEAPAPEDG